MSLFLRCFFTHFASKNQLLGLSINGTLAGNGFMSVWQCFSLKMWTVLKPANCFNADHLTGFCIIRVLTERCFLRDYSKFVNVPKSVSGIDLFRYECKLVIFFFRLKCHVWNITSGTLPFHLLYPKIYFE